MCGLTSDCSVSGLARANRPHNNDTDPLQSSFTLKQGVRNVVIDIVVANRRGEPVKGLDESTFQIFENGTPQDV
jgi:hypothetical protein